MFSEITVEKLLFNNLSDEYLGKTDHLEKIAYNIIKSKLLYRCFSKILF